MILNNYQIDAARRHYEAYHKNLAYIGDLLATLDDRERAARDLLDAYEKMAGELPRPMWELKNRLGI